MSVEEKVNAILRLAKDQGNQFKSFSSAAPQVQQFPDGYTSVSSK